MTYEKCSRCKLVAKETSVALHRRISVSFKVPFVCAACLRMIASVKSPDFKAHVVQPIERKPKKPKVKSLKGLGLPDAICALHAEHGCLSIPFLQRKLKMSYDEAQRIIKQIQEYLSEH
jgi:hypothetical protein